MWDRHTHTHSRSGLIHAHRGFPFKLWSRYTIPPPFNLRDYDTQYAHDKRRSLHVMGPSHKNTHHAHDRRLAPSFWGRAMRLSLWACNCVSVAFDRWFKPSLRQASEILRSTLSPLHPWQRQTIFDTWQYRLMIWGCTLRDTQLSWMRAEGLSHYSIRRALSQEDGAFILSRAWDFAHDRGLHLRIV